MGLIRSWSPSRLFDYETCPRKTKYISVDNLCPTCFAGKMVWTNDIQICNACGKTPESSPALERGSVIHKAAEEYIRRLRPDIAPELMPVEHWLTFLRSEYEARRCRVELMLAFDVNWRLTEWKSRTAWVRLKLDVLWLFEPKKSCVIDWKTGKLKKDGEYDEQLDIYKVAALSAGFGEASQSKLVFTDHGVNIPHDDVDIVEMTLEDLPEAQARWTKRAKAMMTDTIFVPRPNFLCRYCPYSCNVGGPCEY